MACSRFTVSINTPQPQGTRWGLGQWAPLAWSPLALRSSDSGDTVLTSLLRGNGHDPEQPRLQATAESTTQAAAGG